MSAHFSMHLRWILIASLIIFAVIEETVSLKEVAMHNYNTAMPVAVIVAKEGDSTKLQLAIPHRLEEDRNSVGYYYDDSKQQFMLACPRIPYISPAEKDWLLKTDRTSDESRLFFLRNYTSRSEECLLDMVPSIKKVEKTENEREGKYCSKSEAEMYEVGYPVSSDSDGKDVQFLSVYKICHSRTKDNGATLYSIHRIEAPSLLLQHGVTEMYNLDPWYNYHKSYLDENLKTLESFQNGKYFAYRFVGKSDIPTGSWAPTITFLFNYTPITKNVDLFKGMIRADLYTRLYSKKNNKRLTLYSGTYQEEKENSTGCFSPPCISVIDTFWRIIVDDDDNAIFLGTQHTQTECGVGYLCSLGHKVKKYEGGGCIYTCQLHSSSNRILFDQLDLPRLRLKGNLDFTFQTDETETVFTDGQESSSSLDTKSFEKIDLIDFLNEKSFKSALKSIDPNIPFDETYN